MTPEDIGDIFQALEDALFAMAIRTMKHHEKWEQEEGFQWTQWQAEQIQGLRAYRQNVKELTDYYFNLAKKDIESYLRQAYRNSIDDAAETARTLMLQNGRMAQFSQQFFGVNSKKLDVLINEAVQNIDTKRYAAINRMNYGYTEMLRRADIFAQSGSFTIPQAVDMAANDFLSAGLNCVEYSNGNRVNIASYAEMALRTSSSEVTRQANGDVRDELGEYLVVSNVIGITCPICQKWQGRVLVDDVYSSGKPDGEHKLVSQAKADGFMHPNCRHQLYMYIPGLTEIADLPDTEITRERYAAEQKQRYYEREIRKYKRLRDGALDPENKQKYAARVKEWTTKHDQFLREHDYLRQNPKRLAPGYIGNGKPEGSPPIEPVNLNGMKCTTKTEQHGFSNGGRKDTPLITKQAVVYTLPDGENIVFPKTYDKSLQTLTPEQLARCWSQVPEEMRRQMQKSIEVVDYYNPQDSYWRKKYKNFPHSYATSGDKAITFYRYEREHSDSYLIRTLCHEGGHYIDKTIGS
jgi:hypothetical protein